MCIYIIYSGLGIVPRVDLNTYCPYMNDISDVLGGKMLGSRHNNYVYTSQ